MKATLLIGGKSDQHQRKEADFYPTPADCTHALLDFISIGADASVWEPACGDGAISKVLEERGFKTISTDLRHTGFGEGGIDFLDSEKLANVVITNPPFNLSVEFIEKCFDLNLHGFALLLKSTYWHSQRRFSLFKKTNPSYILPLTWRPNFAPERGNAPTMDMCWTVWKSNHGQETKYVPLEKSFIYS